MSDNCKSWDCCDSTNPLGDFGNYSLVGGDFPGGEIVGNPESSFIVECPPGIICTEGSFPIVVTVPKNTSINPYSLPPDGGDIVLRISCANGESVTRTYPSGTEQSVLTAALFEMFYFCGESQAEQNVQTASVATTYSNGPASVPCDGKLFSASPGGLILFDDATKTASLPAGALTSTVSQEDADQKAEDYIETQLANAFEEGVQCGYWNTEQTAACAYGDDKVTPAFTYFSATSQAAADQLALDAAEAECPQGCNAVIDAATWVQSGGTGSFSGSGAQITFSAANNGATGSTVPPLNTSGGMSCRITGTVTQTASASVLIQASVGGVLLQTSGLGAGTHVIDQAIGIGSSAANIISVSVSAGGGATRAITGTLLFGPP